MTIQFSVNFCKVFTLITEIDLNPHAYNVSQIHSFSFRPLLLSQLYALRGYAHLRRKISPVPDKFGEERFLFFSNIVENEIVIPPKCFTITKGREGRRDRKSLCHFILSSRKNCDGSIFNYMQIHGQTFAIDMYLDLIDLFTPVPTIAVYTNRLLQNHHEK